MERSQPLLKGGCRPQFHRLDNECSGNATVFDETTKITNSSNHTIIAATALNVQSNRQNHLNRRMVAPIKIPMCAWCQTIKGAVCTLNLALPHQPFVCLNNSSANSTSTARHWHHLVSKSLL
jgi:hypothetical protein